ncbi:helix-turn-helix domain-containing protein [Clostridium sp.]|uniref:helix-turn-helix domain-containing protein n=1 Tax=Clostridium sp. TaxID=1506 RepID=UPI002615C413|nr:helix-turn-helix domain-containing protein [uncultured Clostridium sp.]
MKLHPFTENKLACSLLKKNRIPISDIAMQCGFSDNNYFSRVLKKRIMLTPKQFRTFK